MLARTAYLPSYQRCVIRKSEQLITPAHLESFDSLPEGRRLGVATRILEPATLKCKEEARGQIVDTHATSEELAPIRDLTAKEFAIAFVEAGATNAQAHCFAQGMRDLSNGELIELANAASTKAQEKQLQALVNTCIG
jgi:hypothetical protein